MTSYAGRHAELYDLIYAEKNYRSEADFVHVVLDRFRVGGLHNILELACGTGSHALHLQDLGYCVVASDNSEDMLRVARAKAQRTGSQVRFISQDMRQLDSHLRNFDAVVCLFDSIGYVRTNTAVVEVLSCAHAALRTGGLLVFEFWHAAAMLQNFEPVRVRRLPTPDGELLRITETELDAANQLASVAYDVVELRNDGRFNRFREVQVNRFFQLQEMSQFLSAAGFQLIEAYPGYTDRGAIDESTWHIVAIARKN